MDELCKIFAQEPRLSNAVRLCPDINADVISDVFAHLQIAGDVVWDRYDDMFEDLMYASPAFRKMSADIIIVFVRNLMKIRKDGQRDRDRRENFAKHNKAEKSNAEANCSC